MKEPQTALEWWKYSEENLGRAMKPYREIRKLMKKKRLTKQEAKKAWKLLEHAMERMSKAADALDEVLREIRIGLGE